MAERHSDDRDPDAVLSLLREQARYGSLVLFLGAGVAHDAGLPTWAELVAPLRKRLRLEHGIEPPDVADYFVESPEGGRAPLEQRVRRMLAAGARKKPARPGALHRALARIPSAVLFTTNFDQLTEEAIGAVQGVPPAVIVNDREVGLIDETWGTTLVKLHGCISLPHTMVLTRSDFETYAARHRAMIAYLQALLATRTFLFAGFSLVDPNFRLIYRAIREALDGRARPAYALMQGDELTPLLHSWVRRGVRPLLFPRLEDIPGYVEQLAEHGTGTAPALMKPHLDGLRQTLLGMVEEARRQQAPVETDEAQATLLRAEAPETERSQGEISARELLDLATTVDRLRALEATTWVALGDLFYAQRHMSGAVRAYHRALRPPDAEAMLDMDEIVRVRGNLARALGALGVHSPAEWLLRRCIFRPGREAPYASNRPTAIRARLDLERLAKRPADAFELCFSVTRRIESLWIEERGEESLSAVAEVRDLLEVLIGLPLPFTHDGKLRVALRHLDIDLGDPLPSLGDLTDTQVYYLNYLGKSYRLSCTLCLDLQHSSEEMERWLRRADVCLRLACAARPLLPYPYAHRLHLAHEPRLPARDREVILERVSADLARLSPGEPPVEAVIERLRLEFPRLPDPWAQAHGQAASRCERAKEVTSGPACLPPSALGWPAADR